MAWQLTLSAEEGPFLLRLLRYQLSELRMEVSQTDQYDLRERLKRDESLLKGLIAQLEQQGVASS